VLASSQMRSARAVPLLAAFALLAAALFAGGAAGNGSLLWLGAGALGALLITFVSQGVPARVWVLLPLAALALWCAVSIAWSTLPDRSWDYADRALVYLLFAALGLCLASHTRTLALGLSALLGAVALWALAGKVLPALAGSYSTIPRLSAPVGLWNQLALAGDYALPLSLWLAGTRRLRGTLLAYVWVVALVLTVSRGGIAVAVVIAAAWLALSGAAGEGVATLLAAGAPAAVVAGVAFALPGVTGSGQSSATRWREGLLFGGLLLAGAVGAGLLARAPRVRATPAFRRAGLLAVALLAAGGLVVGAIKARSAWEQFTSSTEVSNSANRFTSADSNFRWVWWNRAWHAFTLHPLGGTGAGSFELTNLLYRTSALDYTNEPHDLPLQFLSETGLVGFLVLLLAFGLLLAAAGRRRGHELALCLVFVAYLLHSLIDIDWDFVAVSAPAFLSAGALAGRPAPARRLSPSAALLAAGTGLALVGCLLLPWLGNRWANQAELDANPARALATARRAHDADPLLLEPIWTEALNQPDDTAGNQAGLALFRQATRMQPQNPYAWLSLADFELSLGPSGSIGCPRLVFPALQRFTNLDDHDLPYLGADAKNRALAYVDSGKADPSYCAPYDG
jgi:hypothetical protein